MRRAACGLFLLSLVGLPARAWDADTHYDLVYYVALELGYTDTQAHRIASGSISVDLDPDIEPLQVGGVVNPWGDAQTPRVLFHAFADSRLYDKLVGAGNGKRDAADACIESRDRHRQAFYRQVVGTGNPGAYVHFFQDVYDHGRYWSWQGHMTAGHSPDFLSWKPEDSRAMLKGLVAELTRYRHLCFAREPEPPTWDRLNAALDELIRVNPSDTWGNTFFNYNMMGQGVPDEDAGRDVVEKALNRVLPDWVTYDLNMQGECADATWKLPDWVAPSGVLRVKVLDQATGDPIDGAKVELRFPGSRDVQRTGTTVKGIWDFANTPGETGTYALEATADGYAPGAAEATVEAGAEFPAVAVIRLSPGAAPAGVATFRLKEGFPKLRTSSSLEEAGAGLAGGRWEYDETTGSGDKLHYLLEVTGSSATSVTVHYVCTRDERKHERTYTYRWDAPWPSTIVPGQTKFEATVTGEATGTDRSQPAVNASQAFGFVGVDAAGVGIESGQGWDAMPHLGDTDTAMWDPEPKFVTGGSNPFSFTFTAAAAGNESLVCSAGMRVDLRANRRFANDQKFINWGIRMEWEYERVGGAPDRPAEPPAQSQPSALEAPPTASVAPAVEASKPPAGPPIRLTACGGGTTVSIDWEQPTEASEGTDLPSGRLIEVRASGVRLTTLQLPGGAVVSMTPGSRVQITPSGEVNLFEGAVDVDTGGRGGGPPVQVRTPNAAVTDEGTVFHVGFDPRAARTEVRVDEGRVSVEQPLRDGEPPRKLEPGGSCSVEGAESAASPGGQGGGATTTPAGGRSTAPTGGGGATEGWADPPPRDWATAKLLVCERYTPARPQGVGTEFRGVRSLTGYALLEGITYGEVVELVWLLEGEEVARSSAVAQQRTRLFCSVFRGDEGRVIAPGRYELRMLVADARVAAVRFVVLP